MATRKGFSGGNFDEVMINYKIIKALVNTDWIHFEVAIYY